MAGSDRSACGTFQYASCEQQILMEANRSSVDLVLRGSALYFIVILYSIFQ